MFNNLDNRHKFTVKVGVCFDNACYVHPCKQEIINKFYGKCWLDPNITLLVVYGAVVSLDCYPYSSVEFYIETRNKSRYSSIDIDTDGEASIEVVTNIVDWNTFTANKIAETGIVIFDRRKD